MILWPQLGIQSTIILAIISGAYYFLKKYIDSAFGKYAEEKGKNQATKEDIGEITKIVENIKIEFAKQTEELRAQLLFANQHKLSWKSAERDAIVDFNKKISDQILKFATIKINMLNIENYKTIENIKTSIDEINIGVNLAENHLSLFISDEKMLAAIKLLRDTIKIYIGILIPTIDAIHQSYENCSLKINANPHDRDNLISQTENESGVWRSGRFYELFGKYHLIGLQQNNLIIVMRDRMTTIDQG